ncbi:DNA topoisomerase I [Komagataeibacter xylinus]|nr:DNA topoisomerase I [Komagataeibacter xylinus E25]RFO99218.1 DNA topoisomerase I [Komagataeibacter xylinus]RFP07384.1 DNA topoisomerase I [Komagataeibacter xylinus]
MTDVVVVESPAKAKTINKYLGDNYTVLASFGHVRDLPPKDGSVKPDEGFAMVWETDERGSRQIAAIAKALRGAKHLYLATDPDREGEAISWHVRAILEEKNLLKGIDVQRVTFNEITKSAIKTAMAHPRGLDFPLIEAYLARRALDYLVGFTLSPVLWRKLPGSRSAGRVQSVALRLICEREAEIEVFKPREYWSVIARMTTPGGAAFSARLTHLDGHKLDQFDLNDEARAMDAKAAVEAGDFSVEKVERRKVRRNPPPPFTTSTMQQEASRKLGMGAQVAMRTAQQLYEGIDIGGETVGLITYMRTDGVQMAGEAIGAIRSHIGHSFGDQYVPEKARIYSTKAKNAQEAHEAIRPTDVRRTPADMARYLSPEQKKLYDLIWKRSVASQMQSAELDQVAVDIVDRQQRVTLRATGSMIAFDGFLRLYSEGRDDSPAKTDDDQDRMLPAMKERDAIGRGEVMAEQHFTQPPPRYSEASLVKKMEEIGIGRPSTYASILTVLRDRNYVQLENRRFVPEDRGRLVTAFLTSFFERYVDTQFTAGLEEQLDDISGGRANWRDVMSAFWSDFSHAVDQTKDLKISDVITALDADLAPYFFPQREDGQDPRVCTACHTGRLGLKLGRYGAFIGCSNYPTCQYTRKLVVDPSKEGEDAASLKDGMRVLGNAPTGEEVTVRRGPWGLYVQQGEPDPEDKKAKPKRATIPRGLDGDKITLEQAVGLLSLPRIVGIHPELGEPIEAGLGRFGPYVKMGAVYGSLDKDDDVLTVGLNRAVDALAKKLASIRTIGPHPKDGEPVMVRKGRFGPYVQHGSIVATVPRGQDMNDVTMDEALALLTEKGKPLKAKGKKAATTRKPAARKTRAKAVEGTEGAEDAKPAPKKKAAPRKAATKTAAKTATRKTTTRKKATPAKSESETD